MLDMAMKGRDLALNFEYNDQGLYLALRKRGMLHYQARNVIKNIIIVRTYEQLRGLKNRWLGFDEAHFWFFARMYERITLADVQFWSLSRKLGVDVTLVTQRWESIDTIVRQLATNIWHARPLRSREHSVFPFGTFMNLYNKVTPGDRWLGMFMYTKMNDVMGNTRETRKGLVGAVSQKSIIALDSWTARAYDTGRFFTSPLIEEDQREARVKFLKRVYLGELTPLATCPCCNGLGRASFEFTLDDLVEGRWTPSADRLVQQGGMILGTDGRPVLTSSDCPVCAGSGYFSDPSADDLKEAAVAAASGLLGPEIKAAVAAAAGGVPVPAAPGRPKGGWAARKGAS